MTKIPGIPIDRITPDVEAIEGEHGRFWVHSRKGNGVYLVDLFENGFVGKCNCPQFAFRIQPDIDRGINVNGNQFCYHIKRAERCFIETMKRALWATGNRYALHNETPHDTAPKGALGPDTRRSPADASEEESSG